jgi:hypothetical protein
MSQHYIIADKAGNVIREGNFSEPEVRMVAKAGYRVFNGQSHEITPMLTGLFHDINGMPQNEIK